ncbi:hypothetical protein PENARI_c001G08251 [Penicillium arizonense]|uniref:Uncharacterized protein n=1 Tax=Penicillium arizonense TaxID=1835702 RepID=A0A1F5LWS7_PENAI|nr:hypothetical protein PENARI_c001G08251 [Penicillium arizonense]OGE57594.1 hypothetical protein PENARI_c001G08251 [Penicillium arizonense]
MRPGAIAGGVVGGVAVAAVFGTGVIFSHLWKKRQQRKQKALGNELLDERAPQGNQADTQASVGETTQTEELDGKHHPNEVEGSEPSHKFTETHRSKSRNVTYEMDSKVFIAELPALDVPG